MKPINISVLFAGIAAAHSAVWSVTVDGTLYPARDARFDPQLGAKRIEWSFQDANNYTWMAITDVNSPGITCGLDPKPPALKAVARPGADIVVQWSGIIKMHQGPVMSYLGLLPSPDTKPQDINFFKISEDGYNKEKRLWANEKLINQNYTDYFKLPSDIKPGTYILRTELLALHGNGIPIPGGDGPQFYTHCFNIDVLGDGTVSPEGVKFPGAYKPNDSGVVFNLNNPAAWDSYVIPGPPLYQGKYDAPTGEAPVVKPEDTGVFPPEFEAKYEAFKAKENAYALSSAELVNKMTPNGTAMPDLSSLPSTIEFVLSHAQQGQDLQKELQALKAEAIRLGVATA